MTDAELQVHVWNAQDKTREALRAIEVLTDDAPMALHAVSHIRHARYWLSKIDTLLREREDTP